jgi:hypothetical protein
MEANADRAADSAAGNGSFGYNAHYCNVDQRVDPTIVVCSMFLSGLRVFDVRDPFHPKEIGYYNPGGTGAAPPPGSQDGSMVSNTAYPAARPRIIRERAEIWFTDQNQGLFVVRFANGVWPFATPAGTPTTANLGLPSNQACLKASSVKIRVKQPKARRLKSAEVFINGRRVKRVRGAALRKPVKVKLPVGHSIVRIVGRARSGKRYTQTKDYTRCA